MLLLIYRNKCGSQAEKNMDSTGVFYDISGQIEPTRQINTGIIGLHRKDRDGNYRPGGLSHEIFWRLTL